MNTEPRKTKESRSWSGARSVLAVVLVLPIVTMILGSSRVYALDIAMSAFWWVWCPVIILLVALITTRRDRVVLGCLVVAAVCAWPVAGARSWVVPRVPKSTEKTSVSILVFNTNMGNEARAEVGAFIGEQNADVAVILEPVWKFYIDATKNNLYRDVYPGMLERTSEDGNARILVLSRWNLARLDNEPLQNTDGIVCLVDRPENLGGPFLVLAAHPPSPRDSQQWAQGNRSVQRVADRFADLTDAGYRVVLAADLNSPPGGRRDRILRTRAGASRSKPVLGRWGSYPASWRIGRVAIDDVWHSDSIAVQSWRTLVGPGSDHRAVSAVLSIPTAEKEPSRE